MRLKHKLAETVKRAIIADACDTIDKMSNDQADWTNTSVDTAAKVSSPTVSSLY